ncbi:MAG: hypothetical protein C4551_07675 [Bacillota bacterium]|nr:MAG: hypothetical protein C4551_07675 [Bacillota bacterium]
MLQNARQVDLLRKTGKVWLAGVVLAAVALTAVVSGVAVAAPAKKPAGEPGTPQAALEYRLWQDQRDPYRLHFQVVNPTQKHIPLVFPTGQSFDLTVYRKGVEKWRWSEGRMFTQAVREVSLAPGGSLSYVIDLPATLARLYRADATFEAAPGRVSPARLWFWLPGKAQAPAVPDLSGLRYGLAWDPDYPRTLVFTVLNTSSQAVELTFPTGQEFDVVARRPRYAADDPAKGVVWRASDGQFYTQTLHRVTLAAGGKLVYRVAVPQLSSGAYRFEAYFKADPSGKVAATLAVANTDPLTYGLSIRNGKVLFWLYNGSGKTVNLRFTGDEAYRLALVDSKGREVWVYKGTRFYGDERLVEPIPAGMTMNYVAAAPNTQRLGLAPGTYTLKAYFLGTGTLGPHAECTLVVN